MPNQHTSLYKYPYKNKERTARELFNKYANKSLSMQTLQTRLYRWQKNKSQCSIHEIVTLPQDEFIRLCIERRKKRGYRGEPKKDFVPQLNEFDRLLK